MKQFRWRLWFILALTAAAIAVNLIPKYTLKTGLDLQGGTHLLLQADMDNIDPADRNTALESVKQVISRRVDLYGVSEPIIQTSQFQNTYRLIVELPGVKDVNQAISLIGQTAQLDFREDQTATAGATTLVFQPTGLTGKDLKKAAVSFGQSGNTTGQPVVSLEFTQEGSQKFAEITQRNVNKPVAIFLDNQLITNPIVNEPILSGQAVISGNFTADSASQLAIQLNAGALPVPVKPVG